MYNYFFMLLRYGKAQDAAWLIAAFSHDALLFLNSPTVVIFQQIKNQRWELFMLAALAD